MQSVLSLSLLPQKYRLDVAFPQVRGHVLGHCRLVGLQRLQVARPHLGGDLEADMKQLPEAGVVRRILLVVAQGRCVLLRWPSR